MKKVVTISATYGAGASVIAPRLAERLGMPFFDRLIQDVHEANARSIVERLTDEEREQRSGGSMAAGLSRMGAALGLPTPASDDADGRGELRRQIEASISRIGHTDGGVILGRAAAVVLAGAPMSFNVRLTGPVDRCLAQGMRIEQVSEDVAREHQEEANRRWARLVNRLFDRDPTDPTLYHLILDSTVITADRCVDVLATAASAFWDEHGTADGLVAGR